MQSLRFDLSKKGGPFKILNATNGGPWHKRHATDQMRSNFEDYKAARIPYSRNHDSGIVMIYGGPYSHDITYIFPDFDADPYDPASYDFACTDESILICLEAGTETFFVWVRLLKTRSKNTGRSRQRILRNGQSSASILSAITMRAGQTVLSLISSIGKYGTNPICPEMTVTINLPGAVRGHSSLISMRSQQST